MKQLNMFGLGSKDEEKSYSQKVCAPIYEPKNRKPSFSSCFDTNKTDQLLRDIEASEIPDEDKRLLKAAANRHTVFNYELLADYYANSTDEVKRLMEDSALVLIDIDRAIELGYVQVCDELRDQFMEEYPDE
jgi:hypothetical protein